jgi:RNA polymerase sigma-B factor
MFMDAHRKNAPDHERLALRRLIDQLPPQERRILAQRHNGRTRSQIGADSGLCPAHVSRMLGRTLGWLRAALLCEQPPPWPAVESGEAGAGPEITVRTTGEGVIRVHVAGEVDRDNAARLREALLGVVRRPAPRLRIEVHLGAVPLLDAAGIAALLAVHQAARVRDAELTLVGLQPFVRRIAVIGGLAPLLPPDGPAAS